MKLGIKGSVVIAGIICVSAFGADETTKSDFGIRVSLGSAPGVNKLEVDGGGSVSVSEDGGGQLEILAVKRFWGDDESTVGGVLGGGVFFAGNSGGLGGGSFDLAAFGVMVQGGLAVRSGDVFVFELGPYLGIGGARQEITGFSDGSGGYAMYGIKGGAFFMLGSNVELGLELGYGGFSSDVEFDFGGGVKADGTISGDGGNAALVFGVTF